VVLLPSRRWLPQRSFMIRIAITAAVFDAISATLPLGSVALETANERGERLICLRSLGWFGSARCAGRARTIRTLSSGSLIWRAHPPDSLAGPHACSARKHHPALDHK
jgi:hypothetical protein